MVKVMVAPASIRESECKTVYLNSPIVPCSIVPTLEDKVYFDIKNLIIAVASNIVFSTGKGGWSLTLLKVSLDQMALKRLFCAVHFMLIRLHDCPLVEIKSRKISFQ